MGILNEKYFRLSNAMFSYGLKPIEFVVYSYLASCCGKNETCWPSMNTIATNCNCSVNAARNAVQVLERRCFVDVEATYRHHNGKPQRGNNKYWLKELPLVPFADKDWGTKGEHDDRQKKHDEQLRNEYSLTHELPF